MTLAELGYKEIPCNGWEIRVIKKFHKVADNGNDRYITICKPTETTKEFHIECYELIMGDWFYKYLTISENEAVNIFIKNNKNLLTNNK